MEQNVKELQQKLKEIQDKFANVEEAYLQLKNKFEQVDTLYSIISSFASINDIDTLLKFSKNIFKKTLKLDQFSLMLWDEKTQVLSLKSYHGPSLNHHKPINFLIKGSIFEKVINHLKSVYIKNATEDKKNRPSLSELQIQTGSFLCLPLLYDNDSLLGVLNLYKKRANAFDLDDIEFYNRIAEQLAYTLNKILLYEHTKELSITDSLTGVFNRRYFTQRYEREVQRAKRYNRSLSVVMLDIDHFKRYNDVNGHLKGDEVLKKVAKVLEKVLRKTDIIARYGGEEFVLLLPEISKMQARKVADKLQKVIQREDFENAESLPDGQLTISLGLSIYPEDCNDPQLILKNADEALYKAKAMGRNCVAWHGLETPLLLDHAIRAPRAVESLR